MNELYLCDHREKCEGCQCYHNSDHPRDGHVTLSHYCVVVGANVQCLPVSNNIYFIKKKKK
jgi:hypothetical protein